MATVSKRELRRVKYRVVKKCFVEGSLREAGEIIEADEGMEGSALKPEPDPAAQARPQAVPVPQK